MASTDVDARELTHTLDVLVCSTYMGVGNWVLKRSEEMFRRFSKGIALAGAVSLGIASSSASANTATTTVLQVQYTANGGNPQLILESSLGNYFYAQLPVPTGCSGIIAANTIDTIKMWESIATAALLSGKSLSWNYTTCGGFTYINALSLNP